MRVDNQLTDLEKLNETVLQLKEALNRRERDYEHFAKFVRWGVLGFVTAIVMTVFVITDRIDTAYTQNDEGLTHTKGVVEALNNINTNLSIFGMMG